MLYFLLVLIIVVGVVLWLNPWGLKDRLWALAGNSKTIAASYAIQVLGVADEIKVLDWSTLFGAEKGGRILAIAGVLMLVLRLVTRGPVSFKVEDK